MKIFQTDNSNQIVVGQNAIENFQIIDKYPKCSLWFHISKLPSCHVLLVGKDFTSSEIKLAAKYCKTYSKYKNYRSITVEYLELSKVCKTEQLGKVTFKSKPSLIIV